MLLALLLLSFDTDILCTILAKSLKSVVLNLLSLVLKFFAPCFQANSDIDSCSLLLPSIIGSVLWDIILAVFA